MATGEVRRKLAAQQVCVTAREIQAPSLTLQPIHKEFPLWDVLNLVQEQTVRVPVHSVDGGNQPVIVLQSDKSLVVEIDVPARSLRGSQMHGQKGLAAPSRPKEDLDQVVLAWIHAKTTLDITLAHFLVKIPALRYDDIFEHKQSHLYAA